jgi:hypothetical protein
MTQKLTNYQDRTGNYALYCSSRLSKAIVAAGKHLGREMMLKRAKGVGK